MKRASNRRLSAEIAADLRVWMQDGDWTQEEIARRLRTPQSWVSRILRGDFGPRSKKAIAFCKLAGVPMASATPGAAPPRRFLAAFYETWDGTEADRVRLAKLLQDAAKWNDMRRAARPLARER